MIHLPFLFVVIEVIGIFFCFLLNFSKKDNVSDLIKLLIDLLSWMGNWEMGGIVSKSEYEY